MRRIAFASLKGGVGKTTSAVAVALGLARRGRRVLFVDADQQGNGTWTILGGQGSEPPTLADVLTRRVVAVDAIRETAFPGLDLLPADGSLGPVNIALASELGRDTRLRSALASVDGQYDVVVIDTAPQFNTVLANVLVYAHEVIVPVDCGMFAVLGLVELEGILTEVKEAYGNDALRLAGLILTKVARNNTARDVEAELRTRYGDRVYRSTIPLSAKVEEACTHGQSIVAYAPKTSAAMAYAELIEEIANHG